MAFQKYSFFIILVLALYTSVTHAQSNKNDSAIVSASTKYTNSSPLRTLFIGKNYRKEWCMPVKIPVFHIKDEQGGFTILEAGGGRQTKNLRLKDMVGKEWVLRSVDKSVEKTVIDQLKNTIVEKVMQDLISASHPYAALTVPTLAEAAGVIVPTPQVFFIPDDSAFGEHREGFANTVCFLEEREPTPDGSDTKNTSNVMEKVYGDNDHRLLQHDILTARLLDMLIADWDRHGDQWRWGKKDSADAKYYYPIPRDRDFAFFRSDGLFVKLASITSLPYMWGFTKKDMALRKLNSKIWYIDAQWLNQLNAEDWRTTIRQFQKSINDSVIETAVRNMPAEVYALSGKQLVMKLKSRRKALMKNAMKYYRFLAANPVIVGTDGQESFRITSEGKNISVTILNRSKNTEILYRRKFYRRETNKISIMGLAGNDLFSIDEKVSSPIRLNLDGGEGNDVYTLKGKIRYKIGDNDSTVKTVLAQK
jgi:hypothetical protein